jgi:hypothetical protein
MICADFNVHEVMGSNNVRELIQPKSSHMDFNIASALNFATRGEGIEFQPAYFLTADF